MISQIRLKINRGKYDEERSDGRVDQFKEDLLSEFELKTHPKADSIFRYVWKVGSNDGLHGVVDVLEGMHHLFIKNSQL